MAKQRRSWTTKPEKALVAETQEKAAVFASAFLGNKKAIRAKLIYSSSQHGWVIYNDAGTKMIADR